MNRITTLCALAASLSIATSVAPAQGVERINICHIYQVTEIGLIGIVIEIPLPAWRGHEQHGDYQAPDLPEGAPCGIIE